MTILHLATFDAHGGAAVAALRLAEGQARSGHDVRVLVREKSTRHPLVDAFDGAAPSTDPAVGRLAWLFTQGARAEGSGLAFSSDVPTYDLASHPLVLASDVLHLHWVAGFVSSYELQRLQALRKPIVWTLHDQLPFTGGCHYSESCTRFTGTCGQCPQLVPDAHALASLTLAQKQMHIDPAGLVIASPSRWLANLARSSALFKNTRVDVVPYGIDVQARRRVSRAAAREALGIPGDALVLFASSVNNRETRKGDAHLVEALQRLRATNAAPWLLVLTAGEGARDGEVAGFRCQSLGALAADDARLEMAYRAADVFALPTLEDNLPNTLLEAMAAEIPVVAYDTGGIPDFLKDGVNGRLVPKGDRAGLAQALADLFADRGKRLALGCAAGATAEAAFDWPRQVAAYDAIYIEKRPHGRAARKGRLSQDDTPKLKTLLNNPAALRLLHTLQSREVAELQNVIAARGGEIRDLRSTLETREAEIRKLQPMTHTQSRTVIYGAGAAGQAARAALATNDQHTIVAFADGDARKVGTTIAGLPVVSADALTGDWFDHIVVASQAWREITTTLMAKGLSKDRMSVYHTGGSTLTPIAVETDTSAPCVLILTDDCVSPGHGIGAVLLRHLAQYPRHRLAHVYLRRKGDPFWPNSYALAMNGRGEAGSLSAADIASRLAASGHAPDVIYANVFGEAGLEAIEALADAFGGSVPVIQHFHDWLYADQASFERILRRVSPRVSEFWAITDALGRHISAIAGREVTTVNTFKCEIAPAHKSDHRDLDERFKVVMLGNSHMPWVLHHVRNVWRKVRQEVPGLAPIQWFGYPTSVLYVKEAGVEFEPEIEYYGYLNDRVLHEHLCDADLALVPFNVADEPEYHYAAHSVPSRMTEFLNAGLPIFAAAGRGTETWQFVTGHDIGVCATIADEDRFAATLLDLMRDTPARLALSRRGRAFAQTHCDVRKHQQMLMNSFMRVSARRPDVRPSDTAAIGSDR